MGDAATHRRGSRRALRLLLGCTLSALFLYLALRDVDWSQVGHAISNTDWRFTALGALAGLVSVGLRALRWWVMLCPIRRVSLTKALSATFVGSLFNNIFPARAGDFVRAFILARSVKFPAMEALAGVIYSRILDVFSALAILAVAMLQPVVPPWTRSIGVVLLLINTALMAGAWVVVRYDDRAQRLLAWLMRILPRRLALSVEGRAAGLLRGLNASMSRRVFFPVMLSSMVLLFATIGAVYFCLPAVGIQPTLARAIMTTALVSVASMIPATPGNLGAIQLACVISLTALGVPRGTAVSYSFVYHASQYLPPTALGALMLWYEQLPMSGIIRRARQHRDHED